MAVYNLIENTASTYHTALSPAFAVTPNTPVTIVVTAKSANRQIMVGARRADGSGGVNNYFDLTNGLIFAVNVGWLNPPGSMSNVTMVLQNGLYVCTARFTPSFTGSARVEF